MLVTGSVYKFEFVPVLSMLDGIYEVTSIVSRDQFILDGGDVFTDIFEANGLDDTDYATFAEDIEISRVAFLSYKESVKPNIAVPLCLFPKYPTTNLKPYSRLNLSTDLGLFADQVRLDALTNAIKDILEASAGVVSTPSLFSVKTEWLTAAEYQTLVDERELLLSNSVTYYSECIRLQNELNEKNNIINYYETTLKNL